MFTILFRSSIFTFLFIAPVLGLAQTVLGHWTFEEGVETTDLTGNFSDLVLTGATVQDGALNVGINQWARALTYSGTPIIGKTLIAWVRLESLATETDPGPFQGRSGGSVITIDKISVDNFDAITFGEQENNKWGAGSNNFHRTQLLNDPLATETLTGELVQMAIAYECDGSGVNVFRNGVLIGDYAYASGTVAPTYIAGDTEVLFGLRHIFPNGSFPSIPWIDARIEEAQIVSSCLTAEEVAQIEVTLPAVIPTMGEWATVILTMLLSAMGLIYIRQHSLRTA